MDRPDSASHAIDFDRRWTTKSRLTRVTDYGTVAVWRHELLSVPILVLTPSILPQLTQEPHP